MTAQEKLARALLSPQAPLVFADPLGEALRDVEVKTLFPERRKPSELDGALGWEEFVSVTNDARILDYLVSEDKPLPSFPLAGDRPHHVFDPAHVRVGSSTRAGRRPASTSSTTRSPSAIMACAKGTKTRPWKSSATRAGSAASPRGSGNV